MSAPVVLPPVVAHGEAAVVARQRGQDHQPVAPGGGPDLSRRAQRAHGQRHEQRRSASRAEQVRHAGSGDDHGGELDGRGQDDPLPDAQVRGVEQHERLVPRRGVSA